MEFTWTGILEFGKIIEVALPGILETGKSQDLFIASLSRPNNRIDEYSGDNNMTSIMIAPPVYPDKFIIVCKTNRDTAQTEWKVSDVAGKVWFQKDKNELTAYTEYRDTISLPKGHYELLVTDSEGDGLEFWANPRGGMGLCKIGHCRWQADQVFRQRFR